MSRKLKKDQKTLNDSRGPLTGKRKSFDQKIFNRFNSPAVAAVVQYLESVDVWARPNDDKYGPDLVVWRGFRPVSYLEVEVRAGWMSGDWPLTWDPVNIPERKVRNFNLSFPCEHWILSSDLKQALIITEGVFKSEGKLEEFQNKKVSSGEFFVRVPLEHCVLKELTHGQL